MNQRAIVAGIVIFFFLLRSSGVADWLTLSYVQQSAEQLMALVQQNYLFAAGAYIVSYIAVAAFALPIAALLTMTGGYLFGTVPGALYTNIGATCGASAVFLLVRYFFGTDVQHKYAHQLKRFNALFATYDKNFLLMARLVVLFPFFVVNILAGLTPVRLTTFVWTTMLGIFPGSLIYTYAGRQLHELKSVEDIFSWQMMLAFLALAALLLVPMLYQRFARQELI